jgi:hypothetical protein
MLLEFYAVFLHSTKAAEAMMILFFAPAFCAVPPVLETILGHCGVPGISAGMASWTTAGIILCVGMICGFLGFSHFLRYSQLRSYQTQRGPEADA